MNDRAQHEDLLERLMEDPPSPLDRVLRDYYDQAKWLADNQPLVTVLGDIIEKRFPVGATVLARVVSLQRRASGLRPEQLKLATQVPQEVDIHDVLFELRRLHLFRIEATPMRLTVGEGNEYRAYRVPPSAATRLRDPSLALTDLPDPFEFERQLRARYGP